MSEFNQKASLRQLPPGKLNNIKKIFEDGENSSTNKGEKPVPPARPPQPPTRVLSPVRQQPAQQHPQSKNSTSKQPQMHQRHVSIAIETAEHLRSQDCPSGHNSSILDRVSRISNSSNQTQQAKDAKRIISHALAERLTVSQDSAQPSKATSKGVEKSASFSVSAQPLKPTLRHSHEHSMGEKSGILDSSLYSSIQEKAQVNTDVSDPYAKVNKQRKDTQASPMNMNFSPEDKIELSIQRKEAIKKNATERRKSVADCGKENEEAESCSVNVAQRTKFFDGSVEDKPTNPHKSDSVTNKFSMRIHKEFDEEQQNKFQAIKKNDNESERGSLYELPWDLSKNSALEKLKKTQSTLPGLTQNVVTTKCDNVSSSAKLVAPTKPPLLGETLQKQKPLSHKFPSSDNDLVTIRSQLKTKPHDMTPEPSTQRKEVPPKPPRTHAHDDYLKVRVSMPFDAKPASSGPSQTEVRKTVHIMHTAGGGGSQEEIEHLSVKDRISKMQQHTDPSFEPPPLPSVSFSNKRTEQNNAVHNHAPSRPPPPKRRPSSDDHQQFPGNQDNYGPVIIPVSPREHLPLGKRLSEELRGRRPDDQLPPEPHFDTHLQRFPLRKSYSSECIHSSRGSSLNGELEYMEGCGVMSQSSYGSQYEAVIDPEGYAVPNLFVRLPGKKRPSLKDDNLDVSPTKFLTRIKGFSGDAFSNKNEDSHGNSITSAQEQSLDKVNKKKITMVKQKINQAYADVDFTGGQLSGTGANDLQLVDREQNFSESVIEPTVLKKRIEYCTSVRLKSSKSIRHCKEYLSAIYPQLFEYCLVVGLQQLVNAEGYQPYVIHKFPENVSSNFSVPNFCFPDATIFKPGSTTSASESYSFVMTYADGSRVYGYCRRIQPTDASLPEVICIISPIDAFNMYNTLLNEIEARRRVSLEQASELIAASFGRPLPKPGRVCHIRTLDIKGEMETIFLNRPADNKLENVNYESPLYFLGTDRLVKVFSSMLMERRIILCSSNLSVLTQTVYALSALLYPFQWQHVYIPLLPHEMLDVLCAPVPFVVGVLTAFLPTVLGMELEEVFVVDLDKKNIVKCQGDESTILPKRLQKALKTAINMCKIDTEAQNAQWLMVAEAFLRMFIETVGHFNNHIHTQHDGNRMFQKDSFIVEVVSKEVREFLSWFTETQMFDVFIQNHVHKLDSGTSDLFMQRLTEYRQSKEESTRRKGLGEKVKNFGKALKTKLQAS